jgi:hypothetical protein
MSGRCSTGPSGAVLLAAIAGRAAAQQAGKTQGFRRPTRRRRRSPRRCARTTTRRSRPCWASGGASSCPTASAISAATHALLAAWDDSHKVNVDGDKAIVEVGKTGWTLPIPIVKDGAEWRFDPEAGIDELGAREIGRDELGAIQTLLAIVDAQRDYAAMDPMKTGSPVYARRLKSLPGKKDGSTGRPSPASPRARWANWSPTRRTTASRRAAITATISGCSTPRARRRRAARSTTW